MRGWRAVARGFALDEEGWARHANPWSVWTRVATLPALALAAWSRAWIGPVWASVLVAALLAWGWWNPRAFPPPRTTAGWASAAVLGERVWLALGTEGLPARHRLAPRLLSLLAAAGLPPLAWGLWRLEPWPTLAGLSLAMLGKLWFCDRMAWIWQEVGAADPRFAGWAR